MVVIDLSRFKETFFDEAVDHLATIESALLRLESDPNDLPLVNDIFRAAHSIKGASGSLGLLDIATFTHSMESLLDRLRSGEIATTSQHVDLLLRAADTLQLLLAAARTNQAAPSTAATVAAALDAALAAGGVASARPAADGSAAAAEPLRAVRVLFRPGRNLFLEGLDPLLLLRDLASLGTVRSIVCQADSVPPIEELDAESLFLSWEVELETSQPTYVLRDVFAFVSDSSTIDVVDLHSQAKATDRRESPRGETTPRPTAGDSSSIRVPTEKVDSLINLVGEVVIAQAMIQQALADFRPEKLALLLSAVGEMERNTRDLQERVMSIRMLPVGSVFSRFPRLVRDLAASLGKQVQLDRSGDEIELDKGVVDRIGDPLTHLIRNSIDHGLETPEQRCAAGKPETGTLSLRAFHAGGSVVVEISDDGRGLDTERIRTKALAQGLIRSDDLLSDEQIHHFIFQPGFSTAATLSDVSGRGVGMDVVKNTIEGLGGSIAIQTTKGQGTTFRLKMPLTLAIIDGLALRVGTDTFLLPLISIVESLRPKSHEIKTVFGTGEVVLVRGVPTPLLRLDRALGIPGAVNDPCQGLIVIVELDGKTIGLLVDELLGQSQVVIKSLEANYHKVDGVMGATILGDGRVALILDLQGLFRLRHDDPAPSVAPPSGETPAELALASP